MKKIIFLFLTLLFIQIGYAQSNINPDISLIGTFNTSTNFIKGDPNYGKLYFEQPQLELFIDGYLNPFARATADLAYEEGEFSVEELYANIVRGLPLDMQIKAGKYLVSFGKINTIHPHAWPFLFRPLYQQVYFSPEGFNEIGAAFSFLLPTGDLYSNLDVGIYNGESLEPMVDSNAVPRGTNPIFVGRLSSFFNFGDYSNLDVGLSSSYGCYSKVNLMTDENNETTEIEKPLNYLYSGLDFKYKYSPDTYTALTIQGEGLINHRDAVRQTGNGFEDITKITTWGAFISVDFKFEKQFNIGIKYDYTGGIIDDEPTFTTLMNDDQNNTQGIETWLSYYPVEETIALRLDLQHLYFNYVDNYQRDGETTITLQLLFSLGPHKAHPF